MTAHEVSTCTKGTPVPPSVPSIQRNPPDAFRPFREEPGPVHSTSQPSPSPLREFRAPSTIRGRRLTSEEVILTHTKEPLKMTGVQRHRPADGAGRLHRNLLCGRERVLCPLVLGLPISTTRGSAEISTVPVTLRLL